MISRLRSRHLRVLAALALLLPVGFAAGLLARTEIPSTDGPAPGQSVVQSGHLLWESATLWGELPIVTRRLAGGPPPGGNSIELEVGDDLRRPDLLLYWSLSGVEGDGIPADAYLLGTVGGSGLHRFDVPEGRRDTGDLVLYSLAHQEIVGRADVGAAR